MGREIRRVPVDFNWPLDKVWEGFLNPHYQCCNACGGTGETAAAEWLSAIAHLLLMVGGAATSERSLHPWLSNISMAPTKRPGPDAVALTTGLAGRPPRGGFGHDALDRYNAIKKIITAAGLSDEWGTCPECLGSGIDTANKAAYEAWEKTDPPSGDGWQMWETVSEGSPVSPVFAEAHMLIDWLVDHGHARTAAEAFVKGGWAPSMVIVGGDIYRNIDALGAIPKG